MPSNLVAAGRRSSSGCVATFLCAIVVLRTASSVQAGWAERQACAADKFVSPAQYSARSDLRLLLNPMKAIKSFDLGGLDDDAP